MKRITSLLVIVLSVMFTMQSQAKIWRVNNNPSLSADVLQPATLFDNTNYTTNPEAATGDTVYIEPSATTYSGFDINKANIL